MASVSAAEPPDPAGSPNVGEQLRFRIAEVGDRDLDHVAARPPSTAIPRRLVGVERSFPNEYLVLEVHGEDLSFPSMRAPRPFPVVGLVEQPVERLADRCVISSGLASTYAARIWTAAAFALHPTRTEGRPEASPAFARSEGPDR
jgi:hypothetical protein